MVEQLAAAGEVLSPAVRAALVALEARVRALEALEAEVVRLRAEVAELRARLSQNSTNSSLPPSSDGPGRLRPPKPKKGGRRGGQRGHPGHARALLPPGPWRDAVGRVRRSRLLHVDETGWALGARRCWLWVAVSGATTLFRVAAGRGACDAERLLGRRYAGVLTTDRWRAYEPHPLLRRQLCWAHLKRNFQGLVDRGGAAARGGRCGLAAAARVFALAARWQERAPPDEQAARELRPLQRYTRRLLREGERSSDRKARALCRDLLRLWPALWTFARAEGRALGVPVTNNAAERALRPPVLWRKNCFFSQSERGLRFVERMLTVVTSCRQQGRSPLEFVTEAIVAHRRNAPAPRLLPSR